LAAKFDIIFKDTATIVVVMNKEVEMSYNKCICQKCGSQYATIIKNDIEIQNEPCPKCGEKQLKLAGPLSFHESSGLYGGG
jgi:Zn finger protein HypA/HybF involved in hydrogenase expression